MKLARQLQSLVPSMIRTWGSGQPEPRTSTPGLGKDTHQVACLLVPVQPEILHIQGSDLHIVKRISVWRGQGY